MDKKKVKELIEKAIGINLNNLVIGGNEHNAPINQANALLSEAIKELSKSNWISVEDRLPEYEQNVFACNKKYPSNIVVTIRCKDVFYDNYNFIIQNVHVTHWKPIEKLEE